MFEGRKWFGFGGIASPSSELGSAFNLPVFY
jgi:hypothetical protein